MRRFLYRFGYCTPEQWIQNESCEWDDESSGALWIIASDEEEALQAGAEAVDRYVAWLFVSSGRAPSPSWKQSGFAAWIESDPVVAEFSAPDLDALPVVHADQADTVEWWSHAK